MGFDHNGALAPLPPPPPLPPSGQHASRHRRDNLQTLAREHQQRPESAALSPSSAKRRRLTPPHADPPQAAQPPQPLGSTNRGDLYALPDASTFHTRIADMRRHADPGVSSAAHADWRQASYRAMQSAPLPGLAAPRHFATPAPVFGLPPQPGEPAGRAQGRGKKGERQKWRQVAEQCEAWLHDLEQTLHGVGAPLAPAEADRVLRDAIGVTLRAAGACSETRGLALEELYAKLTLRLPMLRNHAPSLDSIEAFGSFVRVMPEVMLWRTNAKRWRCYLATDDPPPPPIRLRVAAVQAERLGLTPGGTHPHAIGRPHSLGSGGAHPPAPQDVSDLAPAHPASADLADVWSAAPCMARSDHDRERGSAASLPRAGDSERAPVERVVKSEPPAPSHKRGPAQQSQPVTEQAAPRRETQQGPSTATGTSHDPAKASGPKVVKNLFALARKRGRGVAARIARNASAQDRQEPHASDAIGVRKGPFSRARSEEPQRCTAPAHEAAGRDSQPELADPRSVSSLPPVVPRGVQGSQDDSSLRGRLVPEAEQAQLRKAGGGTRRTSSKKVAPPARGRGAVLASSSDDEDDFAAYLPLADRLAMMDHTAQPRASTTKPACTSAAPTADAQPRDEPVKGKSKRGGTGKGSRRRRRAKDEPPERLAEQLAEPAGPAQARCSDAALAQHARDASCPQERGPIASPSRAVDLMTRVGSADEALHGSSEGVDDMTLAARIHAARMARSASMRAACGSAELGKGDPSHAHEPLTGGARACPGSPNACPKNGLVNTKRKAQQPSAAVDLASLKVTSPETQATCMPGTDGVTTDQALDTALDAAADAAPVATSRAPRSEAAGAAPASCACANALEQPAEDPGDEAQGVEPMRDLLADWLQGALRDEALQQQRREEEAAAAALAAAEADESAAAARDGSPSGAVVQVKQGRKRGRGLRHVDITIGHIAEAAAAPADVSCDAQRHLSTQATGASRGGVVPSSIARKASCRAASAAANQAGDAQGVAVGYDACATCGPDAPQHAQQAQGAGDAIDLKADEVSNDRAALGSAASAEPVSEAGAAAACDSTMLPSRSQLDHAQSLQRVKAEGAASEPAPAAAQGSCQQVEPSSDHDLAQVPFAVERGHHEQVEQASAVEHPERAAAEHATEAVGANDGPAVPAELSGKVRQTLEELVASGAISAEALAGRDLSLMHQVVQAMLQAQERSRAGTAGDADADAAPADVTAKQPDSPVVSAGHLGPRESEAETSDSESDSGPMRSSSPCRMPIRSLAADQARSSGSGPDGAAGSGPCAEQPASGAQRLAEERADVSWKDSMHSVPHSVCFAGPSNSSLPSVTHSSQALGASNDSLPSLPRPGQNMGSRRFAPLRSRTAATTAQPSHRVTDAGAEANNCDDDTNGRPEGEGAAAAQPLDAPDRSAEHGAEQVHAEAATVTHPDESGFADRDAAQDAAGVDSSGSSGDEAVSDGSEAIGDEDHIEPAGPAQPALQTERTRSAYIEQREWEQRQAVIRAQRAAARAERERAKRDAVEREREAIRDRLRPQVLTWFPKTATAPQVLQKLKIQVGQGPNAVRNALKRARVYYHPDTSRKRGESLESQVWCEEVFKCLGDF